MITNAWFRGRKLVKDVKRKNPIIENVQNELNTFGEEGWELVAVQNVRLETGMLLTVAYLKRKKH
jgi:hypothetical protein